MKLFLNTMLKGLATALVVVLLGGYLYINVALKNTNNNTTSLKLISSSLVNSLSTNKINDEETLENEQENLDSKQEETKEIEPEEITTKSETKLETETKKEIEVDNQNSLKEEVGNENKYDPNLEVLETAEVLQTDQGKITGYGPDCAGCSGVTASGFNAKDGNIYYDDKTFGTIRVVAADKSIPFGSIVKIEGLDISPLLAIVLDRGGAIGFSEGKHAYFDLLYENETGALAFGRKDATFEILRLGY